MSGKLKMKPLFSPEVLADFSARAVEAAREYREAQKRRQQEKARREEQEQKEREAERLRQHMERVERLRKEQVGSTLTNAKRIISSYNTSSEEARKEIREAEARLNSLNRRKDVSLKEATELVAFAQEVERKIGTLEKQAEQKRLRQEAEREVEEIENQLVAAKNIEEAPFISNELKELSKRLQDIKKKLTKGEISSIKDDCVSASKSIRHTISLGAARFREFEKQRLEAEKVLSDLKVRAAGHDIPLESDKPSVRWWMESEFESIKKTIDQAHGILTSTESNYDPTLFADVKRVCRENSRALDKLEAELKNYIEMYTKRDQTAKILTKALVDMGYEYSVAFSEPNNPKSAIMFKSKDHQAQSATVSLDLDGNIAVQFADFKEWKACDKEAIRFKEILSRSSGVKALEGVQFVFDELPEEEHHVGVQLPTDTHPEIQQKDKAQGHI